MLAGGLVAVVAAFAGGMVATPLLSQSSSPVATDAISSVSRAGLASPGYPDKISGSTVAARSRPAKPASKARARRPERPAARPAARSGGHHVARHVARTWWEERQVARHTTRTWWEERQVARHVARAWWEDHLIARHVAGAWPGKRPVTRRAAVAKRASSSPGKSTTASTLHCSGSSAMLPENYVTIVSFLIKHGYTRLAAAGIAGNIWQESQGNPEAVGSGGGGLIGFTPLPAGYVTGNPAVDLQTQLEAILTYNQQWAQYIPALNAATSATQAADIYMNDFERPGIPAAANREAAAVAVAGACGF